MKKLYPENLQQFGKELRKFLYKDKVLDLLPGCGWLDGGCRSLMKAFMIWLGSVAQPYQIVEEVQQFHSQHALVKIGNYFVDGDGVSSKNELNVRWIEEEGLKDFYIRPFQPNEEPDYHEDQPFYINDDKIICLVHLLENRFDKNYIIRLLQLG